MLYYRMFLRISHKVDREDLKNPTFFTVIKFPCIVI